VPLGGIALAVARCPSNPRTPNASGLATGCLNFWGALIFCLARAFLEPSTKESAAPVEVAAPSPGLLRCGM
jgi:hypothetical protein